MTENKLKMLEPIVQQYRITLISGLHIGGGDEGLKIGGIDTPVIKNPLTNEAYIPGSSIKGKMRAMLEMLNGDYKNNENKIEPTEDITNESNIAKSFGIASKKLKISSRLIFSDFEMTKEYKELLDEKGNIDFYEDKSENTVPRFGKGNANPRHIERVPAGVEFEGQITLIPIEGDDTGITEEELNIVLDKGLKLLNTTGIGGGVSRGNGRILIEKITK